MTSFPALTFQKERTKEKLRFSSILSKTSPSDRIRREQAAVL
jgi:hypothetical protein